MDFEILLKKLIAEAKKNNGYVKSEEISKLIDITSPLYDQLEKALEDNGYIVIYEEDFKEETYEEYSDIIKSFNANDSVQQYLHEIGSFPLLSFEEELELGKKISKATKIKEKLQENPDYKCHQMNQILEEAELAKEKLINCNLKLVVSIAKKFYGNESISMLDLVQEGNMGLIKAAERFDYKKGFKFSTYATWWIRENISRALSNQSRTIRIPVHIAETKMKIERAKRQLTQDLGTDPTIKDIADMVGISERKIKEIEMYGQNTISLEKPVGDDLDSTIEDFISDDNQLTPFQHAMRNKMKQEIDIMLSGLTPKEKRIIVLRFGLDGEEPKTLEETSKEFDITRERVRQIEAKALRKIKPYAKKKGLEYFIKKG